MIGAMSMRRQRRGGTSAIIAQGAIARHEEKKWAATFVAAQTFLALLSKPGGEPPAEIAYGTEIRSRLTGFCDTAEKVTPVLGDIRYTVACSEPAGSEVPARAAI
jgi:hypothetical protein